MLLLVEKVSVGVTDYNRRYMLVCSAAQLIKIALKGCPVTVYHLHLALIGLQMLVLFHWLFLCVCMCV